VVQIGFDQLNIISDDLDETADFYRRLGLQLDVFRTPSGQPFHSSSSPDDRPLLEADTTAFARLWNGGWKNEEKLHGRVVIGIRVATRTEVDAYYNDVIKAGYRGLQRPFDAFWGARYAIVEDPNGLAVGLMSPVDDTYRSSRTMP